MNVDNKKMKILFVSSIIFIGLASSSVAFIPYGDFTGSIIQTVIAYSIGALFWTGTILGYVLFIMFNRRRIKHSEVLRKRRRPKAETFSLFRTIEGLIANIVCILSIITVIILRVVISDEHQWLTFGLFSVIIFSLQMCGVLNGKNFVYIKSLESRGEENG